MMSTGLDLPLAPPDADEPTLERKAERAAPEPAATPRRTGSGPVVLAVIAVLWALALSALQTASPGATPRAAAAPAPRAIHPITAPRGTPQWPAAEPAATAAGYRAATLAFPDGSSAAIYPDRVRSPAGRTVKVYVERFDPGGAPMSGVLDMELIVDTPGAEPVKTGFTEHTDTPGVYEAVVEPSQLGIGRSDFAVIASQSAHPDSPVAMASATTTVDVVGGVRFAAPPTARWQDGRLAIDVPVSTRTAAHATVTATLVAGTEVLGELTGDADIGEGEATITLGAGELIAADDPRVASLALVDGTLMTTEGGADRWTDFWRGRRALEGRP